MAFNKNRVLIAPSILAADFGHLASQIAAVEKAGADLLHLDIMDGHFVPNISFGPAIVQTVRSLTSLPLDTHLMIENPDLYLKEFQKSGATNLIVHVEVCRHLRATILAIRKLGMNPGVSLKPATPLSALENILADVDAVLVMSVNPGFGGQKFLPQSIERIRELKKTVSSRGLKIRIEVDGGIDQNNAAMLVRAGADVLVSGTAIFGSNDVGKSIAGLRNSIAEKDSVKKIKIRRMPMKKYS
ncbi:MAG: ribulose-phosphate 3-epimerase, partial [Bacteroidota bacterium]